MKNLIKGNFIPLTLFIITFILSIFFPNVQVTIQGGFAWLFFVISILVVFGMIWTLIMGGELSIGSKGAKGWIQEFRNRKKKGE